MIGCLVLPALLVLLLALGMVILPRYIGTDVEDFEGEKRKMAELAHLMAGSFLTEVPGPGIGMTGYRVVDVEECPGRGLVAAPLPGETETEPPFDAPRSSAEFRTYTVFGIPATTAYMDCEGQIGIGMFRPNR